MVARKKESSKDIRRKERKVWMLVVGWGMSKWEKGEGGGGVRQRMRTGSHARSEHGRERESRIQFLPFVGWLVGGRLRRIFSIRG